MYVFVGAICNTCIVHTASTQMNNMWTQHGNKFERMVDCFKPKVSLG